MFIKWNSVSLPLLHILLLALNTDEMFRIAIVQGSYCEHGERLCSAQDLSTSWLLVIWRKKTNPELESKFLWLASKYIPNWYALPSQITVTFAFCSSIISLPSMREKKLCTNKVLIRTLPKSELSLLRSQDDLYVIVAC